MGIAWSAASLRADIGAETDRDQHGAYAGAFRLARDLTLLAAASAGVAAIDAAFADVGELQACARKRSPPGATDLPPSSRSARHRRASSTRCSRPRPAPPQSQIALDRSFRRRVAIRSGRAPTAAPPCAPRSRPSIGRRSSPACRRLSRIRFRQLAQDLCWQSSSAHSTRTSSDCRPLDRARRRSRSSAGNPMCEVRSSKSERR